VAPWHLGQFVCGFGIVSSVCSTAAPLGFHVLWAKTKLQNLGSGHRPAAVSLNSNLIKPVETFVYLDSLQSSEGYCWLDLKHCIGLVASAMLSLHCIWNDKVLSVPTKIHFFQALVLSIFFSASETWTLRVTDMKTLEAFYVKCLWQILGVRWHQHYQSKSPADAEHFWPHHTTGQQRFSSSGPLLSD